MAGTEYRALTSLAGNPATCTRTPRATRGLTRAPGQPSTAGNPPHEQVLRYAHLKALVCMFGNRASAGCEPPDRRRVTGYPLSMFQSAADHAAVERWCVTLPTAIHDGHPYTGRLASRRPQTSTLG